MDKGMSRRYSCIVRCTVSTKDTIKLKLLKFVDESTICEIGPEDRISLLVDLTKSQYLELINEGIHISIDSNVVGLI